MKSGDEGNGGGKRENDNEEKTSEDEERVDAAAASSSSSDSKRPAGFASVANAATKAEDSERVEKRRTYNR